MKQEHLQRSAEADSTAPELSTDAAVLGCRTSEINPERSSRSTVSLRPRDAAGEQAAPGSTPALVSGSALGHYEILRELGCGGMGRVFLARDTRLARLCAIKLLHEHTGAGARQFLAEARATARCRHENIVIVHEIDELLGCPYMVLEYLEGRTLRAWMAGRGGEPVSPARAIELGSTPAVVENE